MNVNDEQAMQDLGVRIGASLEGGECIELVGDVGAGKTTLTRGLARGLGVDETIQSPSFTINRLYDGRDGLRLSHYDFYRLNDPGIMTSELDETMADPRTVTVIEWADAVADVLPADRLTIRIEATGEGLRTVDVSAGGETSGRAAKVIA